MIRDVQPENTVFVKHLYFFSSKFNFFEFRFFFFYSLLLFSFFFFKENKHIYNTASVMISDWLQHQKEPMK